MTPPKSTEEIAIESLDIPGISLKEEIGQGANSIVYRGVRGERTFAVKIQKRGIVERADDVALRFRREGAILACLGHPGLPAILEIGEVSGLPYIIQEYVSGQRLSEMIEDGPLSEATVVAVGRRLAGALSEVHRSGTVHCDVKPDNILIDAAGGARLIDFGFAVRANLERDRDQVVGTLLYAAPEQTGMLKRPLDGRTDLYGLGSVLYECATGSPPFQASDAAELVRLHAVATPPDIRDRNPHVSPGLAAIIHKLLAKDPDDRYQSREGLVGDFDRLDALNVQFRMNGVAPLGIADQPISSIIEPSFIGREAELTRLKIYWDRAKNGRGSVALVQGDAGLGKTRLVQQLVAQTRARGDLALYGRCSDGNPLPFAPIRQGIEQLLRMSERLSADGRARVEERIRRAAGDSAALIRRLSPALAAVIGDVPEAPGMEDIQDQFYDAVAHFFLRYARESEGALMVLDDVELLDDASRDVLARLGNLVTTAPLLVVVTTDPAAKQAVDLDALFKDMGSALASRVTLPPLGDEEITRLVAAQLGDTDARVEFAPRIAARTNGSPFVATEYVRSMLEAGLVRPSWGSWVVDEEGLAELELPTNVVSLVVKRLEMLTGRAREILRAAAVMGARFELDVIAEVDEGSDDDLHAAIGEGVHARVVERRQADEVAFVHGEVRAALMGELSAVELTTLHQRIAEVMDGQERDDSEHLYAVARHYNLGAGDSRQVFASNFTAGSRALSEYAHEEAHGFLAAAVECAEQDGLPIPGLFHETMGEVCARTGRLAEAIHHFEQTLEATTDRLERGRQRARLAHTHIANFNMGSAKSEALEGLREVGQPFPRWLPFQLLSTAWLFSLGQLRDAIGPRKSPSERARRRDVTLVRLYENGAIQAYFNSNLLLMAQMLFRALLPAARLGHSPEKVTVYSQLGVGFAAAGFKGLALRYIRAADQMAVDIGDRLTLGRCRLYHGFVLHLCGLAVEAEQVAVRALEEHGRWVDSMHYVDGSGDLVFNLLLRGYHREAWKWVERQLPRLWFTSGGVRQRQGNPWAGPLLVTLGRTSEGIKYQELTAEFVEPSPRTERYQWAELLSNRVLFQLELGDVGRSTNRLIDEHKTLGLKPLTTQFHCRGFFIYQAYVRLEQAMKAPDDAQALARFRTAVRDCKLSVLNASMRAHALLLEAALWRLQGRLKKARKALYRVEQKARDIDSPWVLYEVMRQRAYLLRGLDNHPSAQREARNALALASEHGWVYRIRKIRGEFGIGLTSKQTVTASPVASYRETSYTGSFRMKRQLDALLEVSMAAATVLDPQQQARNALNEVVRILGAERAFLFSCAEDGGELEFVAGRDASGEDLDEPTGYSTTVVQAVRSRREPVIVSGTDEGAVMGSESVLAHDLRSIVSAPLMVRDRLAGVLYLDSKLASGVFTEDDVEILIALGSHMAIAFESARAAQLEMRYEAETQKRELAESLREMIQVLSSSLNLDEVLERLLEAVTRVIPHDRAAVYLLQDDHLHRVAPRGNADDSLSGGLRLALDSNTVISEVVGRQTPLVVRDTVRENRITQLGEEPLRSWIGVPLISQEQVVGVLTLESRDANEYSNNEAEIALTFAGQAGVAIENARLFGEVRRLATTDALTGILNRRQFFTQAEREFSRFKRYDTELCAVMIDVDHFKQVNDNHGHAVGDQVLKAVASFCQQNLRDVDILGRYGGEEFSILLPDTALLDAREICAERLRKCIADAVIPTTKGGLTVTISLGVAQAKSETQSLGELLDRADTAMYRAKESGRNKVVAAE